MPHRCTDFAQPTTAVGRSLLPATLMLTDKQDGQVKAAEEARGAATGSAGLVVFGLLVWLAPPGSPAALVLTLAFAGWISASTLPWRAFLA
jgi:hypothetical protein